MANIDTSSMQLNPYVPQAKLPKQEFLVIIPYRQAENGTKNIQLEIMLPTALNIHANVWNYLNKKNISYNTKYDYTYFNTNTYFLVPLKRFNFPSYLITFIEDETDYEVCGDGFASLPFDPIEGSWYILYYAPIDVTNSKYFIPTEVYFTQDNLPMPDISAWEPEVTSVPQNTIINTEDDIGSYIYTENGWEMFANNMPSITDSETELFIRGLVYGEDVEPHEDEGGEETIIVQEGEGGVTK